jgi:hypothetical protein
MQRKARAPRGDLAFLVVGVTRDQLDLVFVLSGFKETKHSGFSRTYSAKSAGPGGGANGDARAFQKRAASPSLQPGQVGQTSSFYERIDQLETRPVPADQQDLGRQGSELGGTGPD